MKFEFTPASKFIPEWNGNRDLPEEEQITMIISVLEMGDLLDLMDLIESDSSEDQVDSDNLKPSTVKSIVEKAQQLLPKYITEFQGLDVDSGPISLEDLVQYPQFMSLVVEITFELINISTPNEDDRKNSAGLSA